MNYCFSVVRVASVVLALPVLILVMLSPGFPADAAPAPVVDATAQGPAIKELQNRLKRVETRLDNQGLVDLISRFEQLQSDMERIIGDLEVQNHQLRTLQKQQKDVYADIDRRLRKLEQGNSTGVPVSPAPSSSSGGVPVTPVPVQPAASLGGAPSSPQTGANVGAASGQAAPQAAGTMSEVERNVARSAYERAFNLLKQRRYDMAITSFKAFLETYPYASYADNAQYWLGEANYANRNYKVALSEFQNVIDKYPNSPKRADAMLKIGYTYVELGEKKKAMDTLNTIVSSYPGSTAAKLAQKRIQTLRK
jgi:tol-pal system protein YbgF